MAECKPDQKPINDNVDLSSISNILKIILMAFNMFEKPAQGLPPVLNLLGAKLKPGMSPRNISARKMQKRNSIGITSEDVFTDGPNKEAQAIVADDKEFHSEIVNKMKIQGELAPGSVQSIISGTAGPIPVVGTAVSSTLTSFNSSAQ